MDISKSDFILEKIKKSKTRDVEAEINEDTEMMVIIRLRQKAFAFYGIFIKEILPYEWITQVPGTPDLVLGVINVRGTIESVLNIHKALNQGDAISTKSSRIMIAQGKKIRSGILVDSVLDVSAFPKKNIRPPVTEEKKGIFEFISGELEIKENHLIPILDVDKIFKSVLNRP